MKTVSSYSVNNALEVIVEIISVLSAVIFYQPLIL